MEILEIQGEKIPKIGLGTWNLRGQDCYRGVLTALELGYRHFDTAEMYRNEREVGRAIADSGIQRDEVFLVTKVWSSHLGYGEVLQAAQASARRLDLEIIDLYLIHWPNSRFPIDETMRAMNELVEQGQVRLIGVSNFSVAQIEEAQAVSANKLFTNQIEYFAGHGQSAMLRYCQENEVMLTAYSPLDRGRLVRSKPIRAIADAHSKTPAQVALRWLIQQENVVAIPKSAHADRQSENLGVSDMELTESDMAALGAL